MCFHPLHTTLKKPERFTYPFFYTPHPLCRLAATEVQRYIASEKRWQEEIARGKMFGVLVVENEQGQLGYLAAYSGLLSERNDWPYFVPPVYDLLKPDGYFQVHEAEITQLNKQILELEKNPVRLQLLQSLDALKKEQERELDVFRRQKQKAKRIRDEHRQSGVLSAEEEANLIRESQFMKAELRRMKKRMEAQRAEIGRNLEVYNHRISELKRARKQLSDALQHWLFSQFKMLNAKGEVRDLCCIFTETVHGEPPAGAGECCAPKLLQYAYLHHLRPVCMAEFWWGASPKGEVRHHLHYYPACRSKCLPILTHMLQGLDVEPNPLEENVSQLPEIIFEDAYLWVVNKPAGMLSVPGKSNRLSVSSWLQQQSNADVQPFVVHRLDMDTSGLLIVAKSASDYKTLQSQFALRQVKKQYVALLDGIPKTKEGMIRLPLRLDPMNRPYQVVDEAYGKDAVTEYEVISVLDGKARVVLRPQTGRTHQLRVHCAHADGLNCPIVGDRLYGTPSDRLYLHAERIMFRHPVTKEYLSFEAPTPF